MLNEGLLYLLIITNLKKYIQINTAGTSTRKKFVNVDIIKISGTRSINNCEPIENNGLDISETQSINNREPIENNGLDIRETQSINNREPIENVGLQTYSKK